MTEPMINLNNQLMQVQYGSSIENIPNIGFRSWCHYEKTI